MKKFGIKLLGLILAVSMLCAILPVAVMATPTTDGGYIKIEESDASGRGKFSQNNSVATMSGGKVRVNWDTDEVEHSLTFSVNIPEAGNYHIWVHGGTSNVSTVSPSKLVLDSTTDLNWETITGSTQLSGMNFQTAYHCVDSYLTAGSHTIKYMLTSKRTSNSGTHYVGAFDFMLLIPVIGYDPWTPAIDTLPVARTYKNFNASGYGWFEETNYSDRNAFGDVRTKAGYYSGDGARGYATKTAGSYYIDYFINVPKTNKYDIWINGTSVNNNASAIKFLINGTEQTLSGNQGGDRWDGNYVSAWRKLSLDLTAGNYELRYLIDTPRSDGYYIGVIDVICIVPSSWGWEKSLTTQPVKPTSLANTWVEGESASSGFTSKPTRAEFSGSPTDTYQLATQTAPAVAADGYHVDYSVFLQEGTYDIYFRAVDDVFAPNGAHTAYYMSDAHTYVDGVEKSYTNIMDEGWGTTFSSTLNNYAHGWLKVSGVSLTDDEHIIRLAYLSTATGNSSWYFGGLDCFAIVPSGAPFTPVSKNITNTKLDYYMSLLLLGQDLANITEDITLPTTLEDGTSVSWASSNTTAIATNGAVIRPINSDANVTLTATAGGYSKNFAVTVKYTDEFEITGFAIGGSATAGGTATATATVKRNGGANGTASLILAIYNEHEEMVGVNIDQDTVNLTPNTLNCSYAIPAGQTGSLVARAFLWTDFTELRPITTQLSN